MLDFGVAKCSRLSGAGGVTATGALLGTPDYMSPEQLLSARDVDHGADLWALGVVAYHCLTGRPAFAAETLAATIVAISNASFPLPASLGLGLPAELDGWFARVLARQPERRFGSAKEMAAALLAIVEESTGRCFPPPLSKSGVSRHRAGEGLATREPASSPRDTPLPMATVPGEPAPSSAAPRSPERAVPGPGQRTFSGSSSTVDEADPTRPRWLRAFGSVAAAALLFALGVVVAVELVRWGAGRPDRELAAAPSVEPSGATPAPASGGGAGPGEVTGSGSGAGGEPAAASAMPAASVPAPARVASAPASSRASGRGPATARPAPPDCAPRCRSEGECTVQGDRCVAGSDDDCRRSIACAREGRCHAEGAVCAVGFAALGQPGWQEFACQQECELRGKCTVRAGACVAGSSAQCRRSAGCRLWGKCTAWQDRCVAATDAECQRARACALYLRCRALDGACVP
ncbi:MAG: hypothetical protein HY744_16720 [Deltaproteobacteria bacterium]|nr:hypothetical protein [Deltaproteobacteria bacterium]